jgi:choline dehydrogenase-like flavoprotein
MAQKPDFVVVGSGGGGGTIAWLLARAGFSVVLLEQGPDFTKRYADDLPPDGEFDPKVHDEYLFRLGRPDPKRRRRGDYCTFRPSDGFAAQPFVNGWTGSVLGGGSVLWGTWSFRALPIDFMLQTHFKATGQFQDLTSWGYSIVDWPVKYTDFEPYYGLTEAIFSVGGDRTSLNKSVVNSDWYKALTGMAHFPSFGAAASWQPAAPYPGGPYPINPVGQFIYDGMQDAGMTPFVLPNGIVTPPPGTQVAPGPGAYRTRDKIADALAAWNDPARPAFWNAPADKLWSDSVRQACTMCGYCGEYLCWGKTGAKSGTRFSTIRELMQIAETNDQVRIISNARAYQINFDEHLDIATGVDYLDLSNEDNPSPQHIDANNVIVSCGAVQSARLLRMSGPPGGLGNAHDQLGRYASFHLFGLSATVTLPPSFQGILRSDIGHTGNTASFAPYFVQDGVTKKWLKAGTIVSTQKKNPIEMAAGSNDRNGFKKVGLELLRGMEDAARTLELRLTADDLPMARNRVDLDPDYVDEYGFPVARITREPGGHEWQMATLMEPVLNSVFDRYRQRSATKDLRVNINAPIVNLTGDHQMGTCRMGTDPSTSVVNENCQLHGAKNVFVVDSSFMPSSLGLNPMMTVVANALRVGSWIVANIGSVDRLQ